MKSPETLLFAEHHQMTTDNGYFGLYYVIAPEAKIRTKSKQINTLIRAISVLNPKGYAIGIC
jgi:hypothetical protein